MRYAGSCHCGKIAFEVEGELGEVMECNCSLCRRRGTLLWFVPRDQLSLRTHPGTLSTYTFNTHRLRHRFCSSCGIAVYTEAEHPDTGQFMAAVNVRCLSDVDLSVLKVMQFDGANL